MLRLPRDDQNLMAVKGAEVRDNGEKEEAGQGRVPHLH